VADSDTQAHVAPERLTELEEALRRYRSRCAEGLSAVRAEFAQRRQALAEQEDASRCDVERCRQALDELSDDDYAGGDQAALDEAEQRLESVERSNRDVDERLARFEIESARFQSVIDDVIPAGVCFLQGKTQHLRDYGSTRFDTLAPAVGSMPETGATAPAGGTLPASARGSSPETKLTDYRLPRGFKWVSLSEIDLARELEGVRSPANFEKVPYEEMRLGLSRLKDEVLPRLQLPTSGSANDCFRELDAAKGVQYSDGLLRIYEAFFGMHDFVYLTRRGPGGPFEIVNGRHRVKMAVDLGWEAVPAQVKE
jgi:hypothetical protein